MLKYYDYGKALSYNATYNFIIGGRGLGKTYGAKKLSVKSAVKDAVSAVANGYQFIYLRRYKTELRMSRNTFFADFQHEFPAYDFRVNGDTAQMSHISKRDDKKREWETVGYFIALVVAQSYKSVSFPRVKIIIYDEFIIEKGALHYLPDEAKVFNNFYSTVDRYKDKTKVLFLANSVAVTNPYFIEYNIEPKNADENGFIRMFGGFLLVHIVDSEEFESGVYKTAFGKFISGTEYADYAVGNEFFDDNENLLAGKHSGAYYLFTLETKAGTFSVWYYSKTEEYFCQKKLPKSETIYTLLPDRMSDDRTLMTFSDKPLMHLRTAFRHARVKFDKAPTRNAFIEIFKR